MPVIFIYAFCTKSSLIHLPLFFPATFHLLKSCRFPVSLFPNVICLAPFHIHYALNLMYAWHVSNNAPDIWHQPRLHSFFPPSFLLNKKPPQFKAVGGSKLLRVIACLFRYIATLQPMLEFPLEVLSPHTGFPMPAHYKS